MNNFGPVAMNVGGLQSSSCENNFIIIVNTRQNNYTKVTPNQMVSIHIFGQ